MLVWGPHFENHGCKGCSQRYSQPYSPQHSFSCPTQVDAMFKGKKPFSVASISSTIWQRTLTKREGVIFFPFYLRVKGIFNPELQSPWGAEGCQSLTEATSPRHVNAANSLLWSAHLKTNSPIVWPSMKIQLVASKWPRSRPCPGQIDKSQTRGEKQGALHQQHPAMFVEFNWAQVDQEVGTRAQSMLRTQFYLEIPGRDLET